MCGRVGVETRGGVGVCVWEGVAYVCESQCVSAGAGVGVRVCVCVFVCGCLFFIFYFFIFYFSNFNSVYL